MSASKATQSKPTNASEVRLVEVLDAYLAAAQEGRAPSRDELLADHPELADDLDACLASLEFIGKAQVTVPPLVADPNAVEASEGEPGIGNLGDFRLVAEVGRGGMGVVYQAVQRSLDRRVALKVLPFAAAMDPTQLRRFHTEALAAAQLHHTHIVPVYSVGCERGVHYYAMQFIEGQTLADAIAERKRADELPAQPGPSANASPSSRSKEYFRTAAALGIQAAEALDHAHKVGIVHRDVKPANLLLDVQGNLWVTDFGLARLRDDTGLTMTGDLLGTLRYMSPEQALAKRMVIDHRTDIYSLGATLYELVTLQPAIDGQDRQEVLRKIAQEEPTPPRRINPSIPSELETILLKAISKDSGSRYATAQELADDLDRLLEHKPIRAKRPSARERSAKWARRHPSVLVSGILLLALTAIGLAIGSMLLARKQLEISRQRDRANASTAIARAQHTLAEQNARLARQAVDDMFTQVAEKWLADQPNLEPVQREFLEKALSYYEEFSRITGPDPELRGSIADAWSRVGKIRLRLGMINPAEEALRQALAIDQSLTDESPTNMESRYRLARRWDSLGELLLNGGKTNAAADAYRRCKEAAQALDDAKLGRPEYRRILADGHAGLGLVLYRMSQFRDAEAEMSQATSILEKLLAQASHNRDVRDSLANNLNNLSAMLGVTGRLKDAESTLRRTIDLRTALADASPLSASYQDHLANSIANLGATFAAMKDNGEAEKAYRRVLPIRRKLVDRFPRVPDYLKRLAEDLGNLAIILRRANKPHDATLCYREALALLEGLARDHPDLPEIRTALANTLRNLGVLLSQLDKKAEAEEALRRAMEILELIISEHPEIPTYTIRFLEMSMGRAQALADLRRLGDAERAYREGLERSEEVAGQHPKEPEYTRFHILFLERFAELMMSQRRDVEAREILQRALDRTDSLMRQSPDWAPGRGLLAEVAHRFSKQLTTAVDPEVRDPLRAIALAKRALDIQPESKDVWKVLGEAHFRAHHWNEAIKALKKAQELTTDGAADVTGWFHLAMACWQEGDREQARRWFRKAIGSMEKNEIRNDDSNRLREEASALLGMTDHPAATAKLGEKPAQITKP